MPSRITDVAKSIDTMVCTESTKGVANPARTKKLPQNVANLLLYRSIKTQDRINSFIKRINRSVATSKSGNKPVQKTNDTERYVEIANTSQIMELKFTQRAKWFGIGVPIR
jgi:hypothetical protein